MNYRFDFGNDSKEGTEVTAFIVSSFIRDRLEVAISSIVNSNYTIPRVTFTREVTSTFVTVAFIVVIGTFVAIRVKTIKLMAEVRIEELIVD